MQPDPTDSAPSPVVTHDRRGVLPHPINVAAVTLGLVWLAWALAQVVASC